MKTNKGKREGRKTRMIMVTKGGCGSVEKEGTGGLSTVTSRFDSQGGCSCSGAELSLVSDSASWRAFFINYI